MDKTKYGYYLQKDDGIRIITYLTQTGLKKYLKIHYQIDIHRHPDECFIITDKISKPLIHILEKKNQNVEGSAEDKLKNGKYNFREYEIMLNYKFEIGYSFVVSNFLWKKLNSNTKKYKIMKEILYNDNIKVFQGESLTYLDDVFSFVTRNK